MFAPFLQPILFISSMVLPAWILYRLLVWGRQKRNGFTISLANELLLVLFVIYIGTVLAITIAPASISSINNPNALDINLIPFIYTYKQYIETLSEPGGYSTRFALENIIGNFILFIPLGIFLPVIFKHINSIRKVAAVCFLLAMAIELTQLLLRRFGTYRTADVDDIILNTLGGITGWLVFAHLILPSRQRR